MHTGRSEADAETSRRPRAAESDLGLALGQEDRHNHDELPMDPIVGAVLVSLTPLREHGVPCDRGRWSRIDGWRLRLQPARPMKWQ